MGVKLGDQWSVGGSVGALYNQNKLITPYIFQTTPGLAGREDLISRSLHRRLGREWTTGRVVSHPNDQWQFGAAYTTKSTIDTHGSASGDAGVQLGVSSFPFHYDASVHNIFPQMASAGASWKFLPDWRLALQLDWIDWHQAFHTLPVILTDGSNGGLPGALQDQIPLTWKSEFVYRGGIEYSVTENLALRGGFSYGASPVPDATLSPLTAAITQYTLAAGAGYHWNWLQVDVAYQWQIPVTQNVGTSSLLSGEYSNSSTTVRFAMAGGHRGNPVLAALRPWFLPGSTAV